MTFFFIASAFAGKAEYLPTLLPPEALPVGCQASLPDTNAGSARKFHFDKLTKL
jgi:hypothetical protein